MSNTYASYTKFNVSLSENQKDKIRNAYKKGDGLTLRLEPKTGHDSLMLTTTQIKKLLQARKLKKSCDITLSKNQIQQSGGFIGVTAATLGALAPIIARALVAGAASAAASKVVNKVTGKGLKKKKGGALYIQKRRRSD